MNMRRIFLYFMTGAALALAGCGGNGGGTPMMQMQPQMATPVSKAGLLAGYMNVGAAGTFNINAGQSVTRDHAVFTCGGTGMAVCRVTVTAAGAVSFVRGKIENGQFMEDESSNAILSLRPSPAAVTAKAAADKAAEDRRMMDAAARAADDRAYTTALTGAQLTRDVRATNEVWDTASNPMPGISVGRTFTGANINNPGDTLNVDDTGVADNVEFMKQGTDTMLGGFTGEVHTKTVTKGDVTTKTDLMIYHDKAATGPVPYNVYYASGSTAAARITGRPGTGAMDGTGTFPATGTTNARLAVTRVDYGTANTATARRNGVLTLRSSTAAPPDTANSSTLNDAETALVVSGANFPSAVNQTFTYGGTAAGAKMRTFDGTFNGIAGKFNCTGNTCVAKRLSDGKLHLQAMGGSTTTPTGGTTPGWFFTPTAMASSIMLPNLDYDTDYLTFGYWLAEETETGETTKTYQIRTFGTGSRAFEGTLAGTGNTATNSAITDLKGKATYAGPATGHYQHHVIRADGTPTPGRSSQGQFTATANLTAQFDLQRAGTVALNDRYTIQGDLKNFKAIGHSNANLLSGWEVTLEKAKFGYATGNATGGTASVTGSSASFPFGAQGGGSTAAMNSGTAGATKGNWRGTFFGPAAPTSATAAVRASTYPTGVAGTFNANFSNGRAVGAYGATRQQQ